MVVDEPAQVLARLKASWYARAGARQKRPGAWTCTREKVMPLPQASMKPTAPSEPTTAVSTASPLSMGLISEAMPVSGNQTVSTRSSAS